MNAPAAAGTAAPDASASLPSDLRGASATALVEGFARKAVSPVEALDACLAQLDVWEPHLNAFTHVATEAAHAAAQASEARWSKGAPLGPLDGVPVAVKDLIGVAGWPMRRGCAANPPEMRATEDAPVVARLRESGAVLIGKTTTPDGGCKLATESAVHGITRNPWDVSRVPGGSSGGSSAALAARIVPIAIGTDGAGSIRVPAAYCNVFGLKPAFGRVPIHPPSLFAPHAVTGPITRTVADTALAWDVCTRAEPRDPYALPPEPRSWRDGLRDGVRGWRIAWCADFGGTLPLDPAQRTVLEAAVAGFEALGAQVERLDALPGAPLPFDAFMTFWRINYWNSVRAWPAERQALLDPAIRRAVDEARAVTTAQLMDAVNARQALAQQLQALHTRFDVVLTPVIGCGPWAVGRATPAPFDEHDWAWTPFAWPFNLSQQPAASVPCGFTPDGLPVGLQVIGPAAGERRVLRACAAFEALEPFALRAPALPASV